VNTIQIIASDYEEVFVSDFVNKIVLTAKRNQFEELKGFVEEYNNLLSVLIETGEFDDEDEYEITFQLSTHIWKQAYERAIDNPKDLNKYKGFSKEVYGETNPILVNEIFNRLKSQGVKFLPGEGNSITDDDLDNSIENKENEIENKIKGRGGEGSETYCENDNYKTSTSTRTDKEKEKEAFKENDKEEIEEIEGKDKDQEMNNVKKLGVRAKKAKKNKKNKKGSVFLDLGSGVGNVVFQLAVQTRSDCYGIELKPTPSAFAAQIRRHIIKRCEYYCRPLGKMKLIHGDFLSNQEIAELIPKVDVVFVNNFAFESETNDALMNHFLAMKEGAKIVSFRAFASVTALGKRITEHSMYSPSSILSVKKYHYWGNDGVSWTSNTIEYYIHTIDRKPLKDFDQHLKRNEKVSSKKKEKRLKTPVKTHSSKSSSRRGK